MIAGQTTPCGINAAKYPARMTRTAVPSPSTRTSAGSIVSRRSQPARLCTRGRTFKAAVEVPGRQGPPQLHPWDRLGDREPETEHVEPVLFGDYALAYVRGLPGVDGRTVTTTNATSSGTCSPSLDTGTSATGTPKRPQRPPHLHRTAPGGTLQRRIPQPHRRGMGEVPRPLRTPQSRPRRLRPSLRNPTASTNTAASDAPPADRPGPAATPDRHPRQPASPASPRPNAKAGPEKPMDSRSAWRRPTPNSPKSTDSSHDATPQSTSASPPTATSLAAPPQRQATDVAGPELIWCWQSDHIRRAYAQRY